MRNAIQFLEFAGSMPMTAGEYAAAVSMLEMGNAERQALFSRDEAALSDLLGGRAKMYCFVVAPDEEDVPEVPEDEPQEFPSGQPAAE